MCALDSHTASHLTRQACTGTYIPPGPMLNSASTRLACLEDVEVDVSPPGSACHLFRRRVFAPEDNQDERFLTASDVVKVSIACSVMRSCASQHVQYPISAVLPCLSVPWLLWTLLHSVPWLYVLTGPGICIF